MPGPGLERRQGLLHANGDHPHPIIKRLMGMRSSPRARRSSSTVYDLDLPDAVFSPRTEIIPDAACIWGMLARLLPPHGDFPEMSSDALMALRPSLPQRRSSSAYLQVMINLGVFSTSEIFRPPASRGIFRRWFLSTLRSPSGNGSRLIINFTSLMRFPGVDISSLISASPSPPWRRFPHAPLAPDYPLATFLSSGDPPRPMIIAGCSFWFSSQGGDHPIFASKASSLS